MAELVVLLGEHALDLVAASLRSEGVDCVLVPPCALRVTYDATQSDPDAFWLGMSDDTSEKLSAAVIGVPHAKLVGLLCGFHVGLLPCLPCHVVHGQDGLRLLHTGPTSMAYSRCPSPSPCMMGAGKGGPWVLVRVKDEGDRLVPLPTGLRDDELLAVATALMDRARA